MKIKKEFVNKTADVHVKQVVLQEKNDSQTHHLLSTMKKQRSYNRELWEEEEMDSIASKGQQSSILKDRLNYRQNCRKQEGIHQRKSLLKNGSQHPKNWLLNKNKKEAKKANCWIEDDENFELVGW